MQKNKYWRSSMLLLTSLICNLTFGYGSHPLLDKYTAQPAAQTTHYDSANYWRGVVIGYATGLCPSLGTLAVAYSTYVSPVFSNYDIHKFSKEHQSYAFSNGLMQGHLAGFLTDLVILAALYKRHGPEGVFWGIVIPYSVFFALNFPGKPSG